MVLEHIHIVETIIPPLLIKVALRQFGFAKEAGYHKDIIDSRLPIASKRHGRIENKQESMYIAEGRIGDEYEGTLGHKNAVGYAFEALKRWVLTRVVIVIKTHLAVILYALLSSINSYNHDVILVFRCCL